MSSQQDFFTAIFQIWAVVFIQAYATFQNVGVHAQLWLISILKLSMCIYHMPACAWLQLIKQFAAGAENPQRHSTECIRDSGA